MSCLHNVSSLSLSFPQPRVFWTPQTGWTQLAGAADGKEAAAGANFNKNMESITTEVSVYLQPRGRADAESPEPVPGGG